MKNENNEWRDLIESAADSESTLTIDDLQTIVDIAGEGNEEAGLETVSEFCIEEQFGFTPEGEISETNIQDPDVDVENGIFPIFEFSSNGIRLLSLEGPKDDGYVEVSEVKLIRY